MSDKTNQFGEKLTGKKKSAKKPQLPPKGVSAAAFEKQQRHPARTAPSKKKAKEIPEELRIADNTVYEKTSYELSQIEKIYGEKLTGKKKKTEKQEKPVKKTEKKPAEKRAEKAKPEKKADKSKKKKPEKSEKPKKKEQTAIKPAESNHKAVKRTPVKIIPLGGLNEIGKNMTAFECGNDIFIVDCGLAFPDTDMPGVDLVIPDFTYVEQNRDRVRGIVITHGHEDHIGGLAYLLQKVNIPVYATRLTLALINGKLKEHGMENSVRMVAVQPKESVKMGCMTVEFIKVNHSIPDSVGLAVHTPAGIIIHTGDFKVDFTPIDGGVIDLARFGELGSKGVLALMSDSTNAERPGHTASERKVGESFERLFARADGKRIIIATFASNIHRIQQIVNNAVIDGRKVAVFGRSMLNAISAATELGYLDAPEDLFIDVEMMNKYPPEKVVLITTGSQGEPMSALTRMAMGEHRSVSITPQDYIIISATPIPGNEKYVTRVVNELLRSGAEVIYESMYDVHVSGHACQEEIKLIMALTRPRFFIPVHGEYKHLKKNASIAYSMGIPSDRVTIASIGDVIETDGVNMKITGKVQAGKVLVDGLGVGDVGSVVLRDRKHLAEDGLIIVVAVVDSISRTLVSGPDIVSRGFVYVRENEEMISEARELMKKSLSRLLLSSNRDWNMIKNGMRDDLSEFIYRKTGRNPMILPIIEEVT